MASNALRQVWGWGTKPVEDSRFSISCFVFQPHGITRFRVPQPHGTVSQPHGTSRQAVDKRGSGSVTSGPLEWLFPPLPGESEN